MDEKVNITDYSFGDWIKRRRKTLDLTQQELAQRVGCSPSLIFKLESDERRPSRQIAELLAEHLQIPADQQALFLKVARQEKTIEHLGAPLPLAASPASDGERAARAEDAPGLSGAPVRSGLPIPLTSMVGRENELQAILQQIQNPLCRLLTLTGPGGVGKTRLAAEVAHRLGAASEYQVCFVSLAGTSASEFIVPAIAEALGFGFSGASELKSNCFII